MNDNTIQIDADIPMPPPSTGRRRYPWREMRVGDSFLAPSEKVRSAACHAAKRYGARYAVRKVSGDYRVWRIA